jgi:hypothetical protein
MSSAVGAIPGARLTAAQRKQQFLDVAAQLVVEQGADTVTMEAVAARAGVSKQIRQAVSEAPTFEDKIRASFTGWGAEIGERGRLLGRLWQVSVSTGPLLEARRRRDRQVYEFWGGLIEEEYHLDKPIAETAAAILVQGTAGLLASLYSGRGEQRTLIDVYVHMALGALDGLAQRQSSAPA